MCGIVGIIDFQDDVHQVDLKTLCDRLTVRGPDAEGFYIDNGIGLGHRRLSIIDLYSGDQPMYSDDKNIVLIYNGEMYNFLDIRSLLEKKSISFSTQSDTEVIIKAYQHYGIDWILHHAEGMFAFALYDKNKSTVYIARDRYGEKPLYYMHQEYRFIFGSELKAIEHKINQKSINHTALNLFLSLSYIPAPYTIYENVYKLQPGHYMQISSSGQIETFQYYNLLKNLTQRHTYTSFQKASTDLETLLTESIEKRMAADVPIGVFLSGGIDSGIISSIMAKLSDQPIKAFSIGFKEKEYDESKRAKLVAQYLKAEHTIEYLDYHDVIEYIDEIIAHFDEPFGDSSAIPSYYVAKVAAQQVKVVLTGDCADELFGGYEKYLASYYADLLNGLPSFVSRGLKSIIYKLPHNRWTNSILRRTKKVIEHSSLSHFEMHYKYMCLGFQDEERKLLLQNNYFHEVKPLIHTTYHSYTSGSDIEKGFYTDLKIILEGDMLVKVDRMCMSHSLESRAPFLDSKIVEAAYAMPANFKIKGRNKKYILKRTFSRFLPKKTITFRKKGFGVPIDYWFNNELKSELDTLLSKGNLNRHRLFNMDYVQKLLDEHRSGKANHKGKLWNLFVFQKWYNRNFP